jgi:hypothetical protein
LNRGLATTTARVNVTARRWTHSPAGPRGPCMRPPQRNAAPPTGGDPSPYIVSSYVRPPRSLSLLHFSPLPPACHPIPNPGGSPGARRARKRGGDHPGLSHRAAAVAIPVTTIRAHPAGSLLYPFLHRMCRSARSSFGSCFNFVVIVAIGFTCVVFGGSFVRSISSPCRYPADSIGFRRG